MTAEEQLERIRATAEDALAMLKSGSLGEEMALEFLRLEIERVLGK